MKTTFPKPLTPDSGLVLVKGVYKATFTRNGRRLYRTLRTSDITVARERRDALYSALSAAGAATPKREMKTAQPGDSTWIYRRKPFFVRVGKTRIGDYDTFEEAQVARDAHLRTL